MVERFMPASRRNQKSRPAKDRSVPSVFPTARDIWLKARRRLLKASAAPLAAAALVFPSLMDPAPAAAQSYDLIESDGTVVLGDLMPISGSMGLTSDGRNYLVFQKMINGGVGFQDGYSAIGLHATLKDWGLTHLFTDTRVQITDHSRVGGNALVGLRRMVGSGVVGGWVGFDSWESHTGFRYEQVAFGAEMLFEGLDVRANFYAPLDDDSNFVGFTGFGMNAPFFQGNNLVFLDPALAEESLGGWSLEAGVPTWSQATRAYAGVYGLNSDLQDSTVGASGRIEVRATNDLTFSFNGSYDDIFKGNFNVLAELRFSGTPNQSGFLPCFDCNYRRHGQVRRDWVVRTASANIEATRPAMDPVTMQPLIFTHVDNTNGGAGDGSFENPFQMLPAAAAGSDYILVDRGVGVTSGNIVLSAGQSILGEGKPMLIATKRGIITAPSYDTVGAFPTLSPADVNAPVITIADDAVVRGFNFAGPATSTAIYGQDIDNFLIECVTGTIGNGVEIVNATGTGIIREADFNVLDQYGYYVGNQGGALDLTINDVIATAVAPVAANTVGLQIDSVGGDIRADLDQITLDGFADSGVLASITNGTLDVDANNIDVLDNTGTAGDGFRVETTNSTTTVNVADLTAAGAGDGFAVDSTGSQIDVDVSNAVLAMGGSGVVLDGVGTTGTFDASNITATNAGDDGVRLVVDDSSQVVATLDTIDVDSAADNALQFHALGTNTPSTLRVTASNVTATNAGTDAISILAENGSTTNATLTNIDADGAGADGMNVRADDGRVNLTADTVSVQNAGDDGVDVVSANNGDVVGSLTDVNASNATNEGMSFVADTDSSIDLALTNPIAVAAGTNGLVAQAGSPGTVGDVSLNITNGDFSTAVGSNVVISATENTSDATVTVDGLTANSSATGNGIEVLATNGGDATLSGSNVIADNNAAGTGLVLDAMNPGSTVLADLTDASFSNNGVDGVALRGADGSSTTGLLAGAIINGSGRDGINVDVVDGGTTGRIELSPSATTNTTIQGSGSDAIDYDVANGARFVALGDGVLMTNSTDHGFNGSVQGAGSSSLVNFDNSDAGDQGLNGAQLNVGNVAGGADQVFRFTNGSMDNNGGDGLNALVDNASTLGVTILNTDMTANGDDAVEITADDASAARLTMDTVDASGAGNRGIAVTSTDNSTFDLDLTNVDASGATNTGTEIIASGGGSFDADINTLNVSNSGADGLSMLSTGANSNIDMLATNVVGDGNQLEGLNSDTLAGGTTTAQFNGGSFSGNGLGAASDGVNVLANGTDSLADFCFDGTAADGNTGAGYHLIGENDATLIVNLQTSGTFGTLSASNNVEEGLLVEGNGADTVIVTMSGDNQFNNNGAATNGVTFNYNGVDNVGVQFSGSVTGANMDGVNISIVDAVNAAVEVGDPTLATPSTITGNGDDGIDVSVVSNGAPTNLDLFTVPVGKQAGATIDAFSILNNNASSNTDEGIVAMLDNVFVANLASSFINDNIASTNGTGDGISVTFIDSNVADTLSVSNNTANSNPLWGIDIKLTNTVVGTLTTDNNTTNSNTAGGTRIDVDPSTVSQGSMIGHTSLNNGGDGVQILVDDSQFSNFVIQNGLFQNNAGRGFDLEATNNSVVDGLTFLDNLDGQVTTANFAFALADPANNLFTLQNTSTVPAIQLTQFLANLTTATNGPLLWDTVGTTSTPFQPVGSSDVIVGLTTVNGTAITAGTNPLQDGGGAALPDGGLPDNQGLLNLAFNDFTQFEQLSFNADVDTAADPDFVPTVADLIGTFVTAQFSNGATLSGQLIDDGSGGLALANTSTLANIGFLDNTLEGIRISATDSQLSNIDIGTTRVDGNQSTGVDIILTNSDLTGSSISGSFIENNAGDGVRMLNPTSAGSPIQLDITDTTISSNQGAGVNVSIAGTEELQTNLSGSTISNNTSFGFRLDQADDSVSTVNFGSAAGNASTVSGNVDAGIGISLQDNAQSSIAVENTTITGTTDGADANFDGDGLRVIATGASQLASLRVGNMTTANDVSITNNAGDGVALEVQDTVVANTGPEIYNATIDNNRVGVFISRAGNAALDNILIQDSAITNNNSHGIHQNFSGTGLDVTSGGGALPLTITTSINNSQVDGNGGEGLFVEEQTDVMTEYFIVDSSFSGNTGSGVRAIATSSTAGGVVNNTVTNFDIDNSNFDNNGVNGFWASVNLDGTLTATIDDSTLNGNGNNGIQLDSLDNAVVTTTVTNTTADGSGNAGLFLTTNANATLNVTLDTVSFSDGNDGIVLAAAGASNTTLTGTSLEIEDNTGNGVAITTTGTSQVTTSLTDASVQRNDGYGFFAVNTANADQFITITGTTDPLLSQGANATSTFSGNGLSGIRIQNGATTGQGLNTDNNIVFDMQFTAANSNGTLGAVVEEQSGLIIQAGTSTFGSVTSNVNQNTFFGNSGTDVLMTSFVAAATNASIDPTASAAYQFDPLARLSLALTNNQGDDISVTNEGAVFTNADPFKSSEAIYGIGAVVPRVGTRIATDVAGVFTSTAQAGSNTVTVVGLAADLPNATGRFDRDVITFTGGANDGETRTIADYDGPNRLFNMNGTSAFSNIPAVNDPFRVDSIAQNGLGASTFVTSAPTINAGLNSFNNIITDFTDVVLPTGFVGIAGDVDAGVAGQIAEGFGWDVNGAAGTVGFVFPTYSSTIIQDADGMAPFIDSVP